MIRWLRAMDGRQKVLIVMGFALVALAAFGVLNSQGDVEVERDEAIATALPLIDFEPEVVSVRLIRQGFTRSPIWAVLLAIPDPGGGRDDFLERVTVRIDATSGEVEQIIEG